MVAMPFQIIYQQFLHIGEHRVAYFRIFLPALLSWAVFMLTVNTQLFVVSNIAAFFMAIYLLKFMTQGVRLIVLNETPTYFFRLKFIKQIYLYITYMYLIIIWSLVISILIGFFLLMLNPEWATTINHAVAIPHQNEIAHQLAQATAQYNIQVTQQNSETIMNFFYHMVTFIGFIIQGILAFNLVVALTDQQQPFYRLIWRTGRYQFANLVYSFIITFLPMLINGLVMVDTNGEFSYVQLIFSPIYNLIFCFLLFCVAQNYQAWQNYQEG